MFRKFAISYLVVLTPVLCQAPTRRPMAMPLQCASGDCSLLKGAPQTAGMRSGFVRLQTGATVGWHTTGKNEEMLVILHGQGAALIEGQQKCTFTAPAVAYIPPETRHNVENNGSEPLEYVYVVAPTAGK